MRCNSVNASDCCELKLCWGYILDSAAILNWIELVVSQGISVIRLGQSLQVTQQTVQYAVHASWLESFRGSSGIAPCCKPYRLLD